MGELLGKSQKTAQPQTQIFMQDIAKRYGLLSERTRLVEERLKQTREKLQVIDETFSSKFKDIKENLEDLQNQINALRKDVDEIKEILRRITKDLSDTAKLSDVKVLEKYINMIDITRLITKEDVEKIVEEKLKKKR